MAEKSDSMQSLYDRYKGAAPIVRQLAADPELREDLRVLVSSGQRFAARLAKDVGGEKPGSRMSERQIGEQVEHLLNVLVSGRSRLASTTEQRHWRRWALVAGAAGGAIVVILLPKSRPAVRGKLASIVGGGDAQPEMQPGERVA